MGDINAWDGDGHVEEWEETFSDKYLEPAFRDRRPQVVETGEFEHDYIWEIDGQRVRVGGSPSSRGGAVSTEYEMMAKWRGPHESGEFHSAEERLAVMEAEDTWLSVNYPTLLLRWPVTGDPALNQALTRSYNNWVADISSQAPGRLKWVTVIDAHDPKEAAREMLRTHGMGSVGVMVLGDYGTRSLDHELCTDLGDGQ
jgi:predicted TIM-barrel fold metal-dependent hydrolase